MAAAIVLPMAVSLLIGTNDLHGLGRSADVADIALQMQELVKEIRRLAPSALLQVNSVFPRSRHFRDVIIKLNEAYQQISTENSSVFVDVWPALAAHGGAIRPEMTADGLHLLLAGYKAWSDVLRPYLKDFAD